ncbi:MAG: ribonuclease P protein component [Microgenomates group bacterium]
MALARAHRLSLRFERDRLNKDGKTIFGKFFTLVVADTPEEKKSQSPRLAILLSKKTAPLAIDRNKIKRITSALLEDLLSSLPPKDYLIIPKKHVLTENNQSLSEDLKNLFLK